MCLLKDPISYKVEFFYDVLKAVDFWILTIFFHITE